LSDWKVVANLPYSVASPIVVELAQGGGLSAKDGGDAACLEVARRLVAGAGDEDYGVLSLLAQLRYEAQGPFQNSRGLFFPAPEVDSACVILGRRENPLLPPEQRPGLHTAGKTGVFATAEDDLKLLTTGLAGGQAGGRF